MSTQAAMDSSNDVLEKLKQQNLKFVKHQEDTRMEIKAIAAEARSLLSNEDDLANAVRDEIQKQIVAHNSKLKADMSASMAEYDTHIRVYANDAFTKIDEKLRADVNTQCNFYEGHANQILLPLTNSINNLLERSNTPENEFNTAKTGLSDFQTAKDSELKTVKSSHTYHELEMNTKISNLHKALETCKSTCTETIDAVKKESDAAVAAVKHGREGTRRVYERCGEMLKETKQDCEDEQEKWYRAYTEDCSTIRKEQKDKFNEMAEKYRKLKEFLEKINGRLDGFGNCQSNFASQLETKLAQLKEKVQAFERAYVEQTGEESGMTE